MPDERQNLLDITPLPAHVQPPCYDPAQITAGIVHIGAGNFFLAHLGHIIHQVLPHDPSWGIVAASIRKGKVIQSLRKQKGRYVLIERKHDERRASVLASIVDTILGAEEPQKLVATIADPRIRMVSLTVSNNGYHIVGRERKLDLHSHDVQHDLNLESGAVPRTIYWYLLNGLAERQKSTAEPITVLSLDNVPGNGASLKQGLLQFVIAAGRQDLVEYIHEFVDFPVTTIDRITPNPSEEFVRESIDFLGFHSEVVVGTEQFRQLVVERGRFSLPPWEATGVELVDDCRPYWRRKFFLLNTSHQVLAKVALRRRHRQVHDAMADPQIAELVKRTHREFAAFLPGDPDQVARYACQVRSRFKDHSLGDLVTRVAARGTSKVSERLFDAVERSLEATGKVPTAVAFATACWLLNLGGDEGGNAIDLQDHDAPKLAPVHLEVLTWANSVTETPATPEDAPYEAIRTALRKMGETLNDDRFGAMANVDAFLRELSWAVLNVLHKGTENALAALLARP